MSGPQLAVEQRGAAKAALDIARVGDRARDIRPAKPAVAPYFQQEERQRFDRQGPGWEQLAEATREIKARLGRDPRILRSSGRLYRSLAASKGRARRGDLRFGTTVFYARFHQYGTKTGLPARPVIDLSQRAQQQMTGALNDYVAEGKTS